MDVIGVPNAYRPVPIPALPLLTAPVYIHLRTHGLTFSGSR